MRSVDCVNEYIKPYGTFGSNLAKLNDLLRKNISLYEAALQTFTGTQAKERGFTQVRRIGGKVNADGVTWDKIKYRIYASVR